VCVAIVIGVLCCTSSAWSASFLTPLPIQDLRAGERYSLGIRPSREVARRTVNSKIDLYAEGLSKSASFRMVGDELWELVWFPEVADSGVHSVRILVTERGRPTEVLEVQELTFVVNGVPVATSIPGKPASATTPATPLITPATKPSIEPNLSVTAPSESVESALVAQPSSTFIAVDLDSPEADTIVVVPAQANTGSTAPLAETDGDSWGEFIEELDEFNTQDNKPTWSLASIASRVVTPHQWVRFPVELLSDSDKVGDYVAVNVDALPNGATFADNSDGTREFQWRPGTADSGEHVFNFTAIDTTNSETRQTVTMRIIVQE